jgi:hypothetical protein
MNLSSFWNDIKGFGQTVVKGGINDALNNLTGQANIPQPTTQAYDQGQVSTGANGLYPYTSSQPAAMPVSLQPATFPFYQDPAIRPWLIGGAALLGGIVLVKALK